MLLRRMMVATAATVGRESILQYCTLPYKLRYLPYKLRYLRFKTGTYITVGCGSFPVEDL